MPRDAKAYLADIIDACDAIGEYVKGATFERYVQERMLRNAVERCLFIAGEAVTQLRKMEPADVLSLGDVEGIIKVRNILAHSYFAVKHDLAWDMATHDAPALRAAAQTWLDRIK